MKKHESKGKVTPQSEEEIMAEKLRAVINKFSCQSKIYDPIEWWEFMG